MYKVLSFFIALVIPTFAFAQAENLTRRDAYLLIWNGINRPAYETRMEYNDVREGDIGYLEISYGKRRGILPDEDLFKPDEPALLHDALLWIFRTRNVRYLDETTSEDLPSLISDYPILEMNRSLDDRVTYEYVQSLAEKLDELLRREVHEVSYYADDFHGAGTAFGETFNMYEITAAHRTLPHNTLVKVTNQDNGDHVVVRINDRGPYVHGRDMDLSLAAFEKIAHKGQGVLKNVTFERLGDAEIVDECEPKPTVYQKRITRDVHFFRGVPHEFSMQNQLVLQSSKPFVVRGITFPDGDYVRIQDFVLPEEKYRFTPDSPGLYSLYVGDALGRRREMRMRVSACSA